MQAEDEGTSSSGSEDSSSESEDVQYVRTTENGGLGGSSRSAFDAYFAQASRSHKTSSNVFSELVTPLSEEEFAEQLQAFNDKQVKTFGDALRQLEQGHDLAMSNYLLELSSGFNLIFYGLGSKRRTLNRFAMKCAKIGHVVVANGFAPTFNMNALVGGIERTLAIDQLTLSSSGMEGRIQRIHEYFTPEDSKRRKRRPLYIIFHNLDIFLQRYPKHAPQLAQLLSCSSIRTSASTDRISSSTYIQISDFMTNQRAQSTSDDQRSPLWLWHDLTTMQSYDFELSHSDRTSYLVSSSKEAQGGSVALGVGPHRSEAVTEKAAHHVLASVTEKAKKLFKLLAQKQVDNMQATSQGHSTDQSAAGISYDLVFAMARDNFLASNDTALRALLSEYRDHGLLVGTAAGSAEGGEVLWIPLSADALRRVSESI
jgi:origin recognition complex subunit 2